MRHQKAKAWEKRLKSVFNEIDTELERQFGETFSLHPARAPENTTSNPEMDGLFNVGASFSAGFGSRFGPGYVVDIRFSTLQKVPRALKQKVRDLVQLLLLEKLPVAFPTKELHVDKERQHLRIHGDLSF